MKNSFYVDACIYLNLWQKEGNERFGVPYWKLAKDFFEKFDNGNTIFYYSGFLLKELKFIAGNKEFDKKEILFNSSSNFKKIALVQEEFIQARKIESELNFEVSFYDIIHMLLAKKTASALITRDRKLLSAAEKYGIKAYKPEFFL